MTRALTADREELQDAARLLLAHPLLTATGAHAAGFRLVRRHRQRLVEDFRQLLGYRLVVEAGFARLYKGGLGSHRGRPLLRSTGAPFQPRGYVYLTLTCAVLLTSRSQILLSGLVEEIRSAAAEADIDLGGDSMTERRALVSALRQLVAWGVLEEDDGSVDDYANDSGSEALLFVNRDLVRHLLAVALREVSGPEQLIALAAEPGAVGGPRHAVRRRIVEEPAVLSEDLDDGEWAWLRQYQRREAQILEESFGLDLEVRAEGVAAIDPQGSLSDLPFPGTGTLGQAALLAVAELVRRHAPAQVPQPREGTLDSVEVTDGEILDIVSRLVEVHRRRWRKDYVERPHALAADVTDLLAAMGLIDRDRGRLRLRAVAARYRPTVVEPAAATLLPEER